VKSLRIHEAARREANLATARYAEINIDLGRRFRDELLQAFSRAAAAPLRYSAYLHGTRRILLRKFPYFIVVLYFEDAVNILAVAHAKRRPGYWRGRV
jgi:toxin ParE1/3/4